jgi:glycosyltransferase involved in cell wall biosynthesis
MKSINLTIIIPTYNRGEILRENIMSLLKCDYAFELLVVDDGSTDGTERVVKSFEDPRITYIKHFSRHGYARSMNDGIEHAKYSWVLLLEDDVFIVDPDVFFETLLSERGGYKRIIATHLLLRGKEVKLTFLKRLKRFFAEPLAGEIYLYNGSKRKIVRFCNACCSFNKEEIRTRFDESDYLGNAFRIESDFQIRARKEGATIIYNPKLIIDHKRHPVGGHRVRDRDDFLYQCMVNHIIFLKKHYSICNIYIYVLLKLLVHPTKWFVIKDAIKKHVNLIQNALIDY